MYWCVAACRFNSLISSSVTSSSSEYFRVISCIWDEPEDWKFSLVCPGWEPSSWLEPEGNWGLAVAFSSQWGWLINFVRAADPSLPVMEALCIKGVAAQLGGWVIGTDLGHSIASAELGLNRILGVPVWLDGGLLTRPVHALAASSPEIAEKAFSLSAGQLIGWVLPHCPWGAWHLIHRWQVVATVILEQLEYVKVI